jgi:xylan 1,4-beta-xylosidase
MGSPAYPDRAQLQILMNASELKEESVDWKTDGNAVSIDLLIEPHSVVAIVLVVGG